jgi:hypothetical protein
MNFKQQHLFSSSWLKRAFLAIIYCLVTQLSYAALSGTYTINPGGAASASNYKSLTSALSDLTSGTRSDGGVPNGAGVTGAVILELASGYTSGSETFPLNFGAINGVSSSNTITVRPASNASSTRSITSSNTTATIDLNGCNYVIFDGRAGGTGTNKRISIVNTSTSGVALRYINDASNNIIKHCTLRGENTDTIKAVVLFSTTAGITGNDSNTLDSCEIREEVTNPANAIYSAGTPAKDNSGNTVSNCHIYNFFSATLPSAGVALKANNDSWNIIGNHFYQTASRTATVANFHRGVYITSGNGHVISSNSIGGGAANAGGNAWTQIGSVENRFIAIDLSVGTGTVTSVQGNTIANFSFSTSSNANTLSGVWCGINLTNGKVNVGNISGNNIGNSSTGSISVTTSSTGAAVTGIHVSSSGVINLSNNNIGSITSNGSSASISCSINGILSGATGTLTISGNTIGHPSTANSLNAANSSNSGTEQRVRGIHSSPGTGNNSITVTNNIIANLNNNYIGVASTGQTLGISCTGGVNTITGNTIRNLSTTSRSKGVGGNASLVGIYFSSLIGTGSQSVSQNVVHTLTNATDTAAVTVLGIYTSCPSSGTHIVSRNFVHSLNTFSTNTSSILVGILAAGGTGINYQNNMIRLGINASGGNITKGYSIYGIYQTGGTNLKFFHNSVYIGGIGVFAAANTGAFYRTNSGVSVNLINNILVNARSNSSGSASNSAIWISNTTDYTDPKMISNHNVLHTQGNGGLIGLVGSTAYASLALWQDSTRLDTSSGMGNPGFVNATGNESTVDLHNSGNTPIEGYGSTTTGVTIDFDDSLRANYTAVDIGADAGNFTAIDAFLPQFYFTPFSAVTSSSNNRVLTVNITDIGSGVPTSGANRPRMWYRRSAPSASSWVNSPGTFISGTGNSGNWSFAIDYSALSITPTFGETYQYYLVAQDQASTPNLSFDKVAGASHANVSTQTTAPNTPNSYSITAPLGTTINVGSGQTYTTLTGNGGLFATINGVGLTGNTTVNITSDLNEDGTHALTGAGLSGYTLTIKPSAAATRVISNSANLAVSMLRFDGVTGLTINGSSGGSGRYLRIVNTHTTASSCKAAIEIFDSSTNSSLRNCIIETNATANSLGNLLIGIGTNTGIGIYNNDIRDAQGTPGTVGIPRHLINSTSDYNVVTITDNNLHNFTNQGINLNSVGDGCIVSGNSVYYNASTAPTLAQVGIYVGGGNNQTIVGNFIGGQSPNCGGSAWTNNGNVGFTGIQVSLGSTITSLIKGNTIQNISLTGTGTNGFYGISTYFGLVNIDSNLIGHASMANSIHNTGGTVSGSPQTIGIINNSNGTGVISNNTVANITNSTSPSNVNPTVIGITSSFTISNNTIYNLSSNGANNSVTAAPVGIFSSGSFSGQSINNNTVYNLSNTNTTAVSPAVHGIAASGVSSNSIINNRIYGLSNSATGATPAINGILSFNNTNLTIANNQISLTNDTNTNSVVISGIQCGFTTGNILYNSVYIGGSGNSKSYGFLRLTSNAVTLRNNLLYNERSGAIGNHYAIGNNFGTPATGWSSSASNYNLYVVSNLNKMGEWGGSSQTLAQWKSSSAGDSNSVVQLNSTIPSSSFFTGVNANPINLGISSSSQVYVKDLGTPISAITTDYNGNPRPTSITSIGAFEYSNNTSSNNANLSSLSLSVGTLSPSFASDTISYLSSVSNATSSITVTPTRSEPNATIEIRVNGGTYSSVNSGTASGSLALNVGLNSIEIRVTAQDGTTQKTYTVAVTRAAASLSNNANLSNLTLSIVTLSPTFDSTVIGYTASVSNATGSITVTPTKVEANASIQVRINGGTYSSVNSGTASGSLALNVGLNSIEIRVTAQDGTTQKTYTVAVTRAAASLSNNANLSNLTLITATLSPTFDSTVIGYTSSVSNATGSITATPTKVEANATIQVRINGGTYSSVTSGTASGSLALNVGSNSIEIRVTAQDGTTQKTYTLTVTRASSNPEPTITVSGTLDTLATCSGMTSVIDSFSVSGSNLGANISIIAPTGFEISTSAGTGFTNNLSLPQSAGSVASTKIFVRLMSSATGTPSGNIVLYSSGDNSETIGVRGLVNPLPTITLGTVNSVLATATSFNLPYTATTGSPNQYSIATGTPSAMSSFTAVNSAVLSSSPIVVSIPASLANTYNFNLTVKNTTTGCASNNLPFMLSVGNPSIANNTITGNQLICAGTEPLGIVGSTPTGGNNTYTYNWLKSTTSATAGYTSATGTSNLQNYLPPILTQNTWFKRIVSSGSNSDSSNAILITVGDTTMPIVRPRNMVAYLNSTGTVTLTALQIDSASTDNCGIQSKTLSNSSFNCSHIGSNQVYLIIADASGNKDSALSIITVLDTIVPNAIAQNRTIYLNSSGIATLSALQVNNGSTDVCGIASMGLNKTSFDCSNLGNNNVTLTVTDVNGNVKTTTSTIAVLDTIKPMVSLNSGIVLYLNAQGALGVSTSQFVSSSSDNCSIASTTINPSNINCSHLGITPIMVTITDANGNKDSTSTNAIVLDPIAPVARPKARLTIYLSGNGQAVINPALLDSASTDNCSITSRVLSQSVFNCSNIGSNNVAFTVQDQSGNSHAANVAVTVLDTIVPVATVSNQLVYLNSSGTATITASQVNNNSTDNCGILSVSINKTSFNCSDLGNRTILFSVTDLNGNVRQTPVTVNVYDTIRPVIRPKRIVNVYLNALGSALLTTLMVDSASTDNCGIATRSLNQSTFTCANLGANTVTLSGADSTGNIGLASFTVLVLDTITPSLTTKPVTIYLSNSGTANLASSQVVLSSSDNCGLVSTTLSTNTFTCANLGNNNVTVTVTDGSNNFRSASAIVTVVDTLKPNALAQNRTVYLNALGLASISALQVDNGSTDNCTIATRIISKSSFTAADLGSNQIIFTVTDNSNNSLQTQVQITVLDTIRPIIQTQNRNIYLNSSGTATISATLVNNGSTDNVGISSIQLSKTLFTCADLGNNQVFLTITDISNNSSSASANITVIDTIKPIVNTQNVTLYLNAIGQATLSTTAANNGSYDNCAIGSLSLSKSTFTCNDKGVNSIQLSAVDASSNVASASLLVTVLDTMKPNVVVNNNLTLYLNNSGSATLTTSMANNGSTDNCGIQSQTLSKTSFNGTNLGLNLVTYTIADASNNQSSVILNISILDTIRPVLNAQNRTIYLDANGNAILTPAMVNNGSTDNVAVTQLQLSKTNFNCSNIGINQVSFTISDMSNNQTSALVNITVIDTIKPLVQAQNLTVYLNAAGTATISVEQANNGSSDNCAITNLSLSKLTFSCMDKGTNSVILSVKDASNNMSTVSFNVTVLDTLKPIILINPIVLLYLDNTGNATLSNGMVNLGSYDNCNSISLNLSKTSFNGSNLGANQVLLTVADPSNNQSTATIVVNVIDTVRPIVKSKDLTLYLNTGGSVFLTATDVNNGSTDNVGISYSGISKSLFTCNETGTNLVEFTVQDITGNRSSQWVTITVLDTILPIVSNFPSSVVLGHCNQDFQFTQPFATDNCGLITTVQTAGIPNGKKYPIGTTTNTFSFTDKSGNVVSRSFTVTILPAYLPDTFPNKTACSSDSPFDLTRGNANVEFSGSGVTLDGLQFDPRLAGSGNHAVICTFTDSTGCETKATFYVTVYRSPDKPVIERMSSDVLQVVQSYDFYQWRRNYEDIPGANQRSYSMTKTGIYSVRVGTVAGCSTESDLLGIGVPLGLGINDKTLLFNLFPNPTQDNFRVDVDARNGDHFTIKVFDLVGRLVYESIEKGFSTDIDASQWRAGTYMVHVETDNKSAVKPVIITK